MKADSQVEFQTPAFLYTIKEERRLIAVPSLQIPRSVPQFGKLFPQEALTFHRADSSAHLALATAQRTPITKSNRSRNHN